jgi:hypothetical protein
LFFVILPEQLLKNLHRKTAFKHYKAFPDNKNDTKSRNRYVKYLSETSSSITRVVTVSFSLFFPTFAA